MSAVQIDIPDCDRHIRTYTFAGLRSLQVQALSHIDPLNSASNYFKAAVYKGESKTKKHKFMINIHWKQTKYTLIHTHQVVGHR